MFLSSDYHKHPLIDRFFCSFLDHEYNILAHGMYCFLIFTRLYKLFFPISHLSHFCLSTILMDDLYSFNRIDLPLYDSKEDLKEKLYVAITMVSTGLILNIIHSVDFKRKKNRSFVVFVHFNLPL